MLKRVHMVQATKRGWVISQNDMIMQLQYKDMHVKPNQSFGRGKRQRRTCSILMGWCIKYEKAIESWTRPQCLVCNLTLPGKAWPAIQLYPCLNSFIIINIERIHAFWKKYHFLLDHQIVRIRFIESFAWWGLALYCCWPAQNIQLLWPPITRLTMWGSPNQHPPA